MILTLSSSSKVAYDKDIAFGISHWGPKRKLFYKTRQVVQSSHKVYSWMKILSIISLSIDKQFGYGHLKEIMVRRANQKEYTFKEGNFPRLHLNDIKDMYLMYAQNKLHHLTGNEQTYLHKEPYTIFHKSRCVVYLNKDEKKHLTRDDELYKFGDGTLKNVCDKLAYMLHNFVFSYNDGMPNRSRTDKDQRRTTSMLEKIKKTLLTRRIMRSLECFVGGRKIKMDYRLLT
ncbi:hypothetical protein Tco_0727539 [Tanacetum coccineum]|uniref:Uncharacterized protein n=1 Tax=Tanacetum coccineum TaxID=301880 RepID=A0ABQ4YLN6_9ASTR